ncbi:MAG: UvrD-helicase domain-containing protein, partial [Clostridia bacterium]|nr:UvrD-helicase domain-containing protein [Clostridia bacterium]
MEQNKLTESQRAAIEHDEGNLLVSASAGSGKTFVMIERIVRLVVEGKAEINEILAVTFTNLAADQMKKKLMHEVVKRLSSGVDPERMRRAVAEIPTASISTVHSFCADLLRTYFYAADVDPTFAIADDSAAEELKKRAIDRLFSEKYATGDPEFLYLARIIRSRRKDDALKKLVLEASEYASSEADPAEYLARCGNAVAKDTYFRYAEDYRAQCAVRLRPVVASLDDAISRSVALG